jgi:hypothetical protein
MNKTQLQEKLQYFVAEGTVLNVELYLQYEVDQQTKSYLPAAEENKLSPALGKMVSIQIKSKFFVENDNYQYEVVSAHSAEANDIRQIFHISQSKIPKASTIFGAVVKNEAEEFPTTLELKDAWGYIFKVECLEGTIYLWKRNYPVAVINKDRNYSIFFSNRKLNLFDKDLLRLSNHFDVMLVEKELIIINRTEFEKAFDYVEAMQTTASENVKIITMTNLIDTNGLAKIADLSKSKKTLRKLLNINPKSKVLSKEPTQIAKLAKKYRVEFILSEDKKQLMITTKKAAIAFVEMLNDDYLKSEFSGSLYKIKGKSIIEDKKI